MKKEKLMKIQERLVFLLIFLFLLPIGVIAQQKMITGQVVDEQGEAVIGASVMVQGSSLGTITNVDGRYTLANVPENRTITVSYIGYITVNYAATSRNLSQVVLREDSKTLEEVVVVGYGTTSRKNLTTSIATVKTEKISKIFVVRSGGDAAEPVYINIWNYEGSHTG